MWLLSGNFQNMWLVLGNFENIVASFGIFPYFERDGFFLKRVGVYFENACNSTERPFLWVSLMVSHSIYKFFFVFLRGILSLFPLFIDTPKVVYLWVEEKHQSQFIFIKPHPIQW